MEKNELRVLHYLLDTIRTAQELEAGLPQHTIALDPPIELPQAVKTAASDLAEACREAMADILASKPNE